MEQEEKKANGDNHMTPTPGPELDELVARVMGYTVRSGVMEYDGQQLPWTVYEKYGKTRNPVPFSTSIASAWEVVAFLRSTGHYVTLTDCGGEWDCAIP